MLNRSLKLPLYLHPLIGLLLLPSVAQGAGPTVTTLRNACSGAFPAVETLEQLSCVRYIDTVQDVGVLDGSLCGPMTGSTEVAAVGLWLYLGQFHGDELAEPHVLNFLRDGAYCAPLR